MIDQLTAAKATRTLRIFWAVVLAEVIVVGVVAYVKMMNAAAPVLTGTSGGTIGKRQAYLYIALLVGAAVAYFTRMQFYKRHWRGDHVEPRGYVLGNVVLFVILNVIALTSFILYMTGSNILTIIFPGFITTLLLAVNFPTGGPMMPYRSQLQ